MKRLLLILLGIGIASSLVFARNIAYNHKKPPRLPLQEAYPCAMHALGNETNTFYCLNATVAIMRSPDGEWLFDFESTNGAVKNVFVFFDKTTEVVNGPLAVF